MDARLGEIVSDPLLLYLIKSKFYFHKASFN